MKALDVLYFKQQLCVYIIFVLISTIKDVYSVFIAVFILYEVNE